MLNYLSKLEEVAKLEPCGIHYVENSPDADGDIAHVVARTAGANRKYFYRRRQSSSWTPWEEIKLDIEDNPVLPVIWKGRLFLFWLRILKQAPLSTPPLPSGNLADLPASSLVDPNAIKMKVQSILCRSEYYNGKWQPTRTSDVNRPAEPPGDGFSPAGQNPFDRSMLRLTVSLEESGALRLDIFGQGDGGVPYFRLYNTHTSPEANWYSPTIEDNGLPTRTLDTSSDTFAIIYDRGFVFYPQGTTPLPRTFSIQVLNNQIGRRTIEPRHDLHKPWLAPFFYEDSHHVFYVSTTQRILLAPEVNDYGASVFPKDNGKQMPPLVVREDPRMGAGADDVLVTLGRNPGVVDPAPIERFVSEDAYINKGIGTTGAVRYGETEIGPAGGRNTRRRAP